mgnify:FL=1
MGFKIVLTDKNSKEIVCRKCNGIARAYKFVIQKYKGSDKRAFHYKIRCPKCGDYHIKREKEMYELLKDVSWIKSKQVLRLENLENGLFS